jgi:hypothetical protein
VRPGRSSSRPSGPKWPRRLAGLSLSFALGCTSDEWPLSDDESSSDGGEGDTTAAPIDGAELEVFEPETPSIHYIGETVPLSAEVRGADGLSVGFDDIVWTASDYGPTLLIGPDGEAELPPGIYDITATAKLPNGDRLESTVGGIRVQTRWTGIYSGDTFLTLVVDFQGTPLAPTCNGTLDLVVGFDGDMVAIEGGTCVLNAIIAQLEATYTLTGEFQNGVGHGTIDYDVGGLLMFSFEWTGALTEEGFLGGFSGTVPLPFVGNAEATGRFNAPLISPYVDTPP